eukprot:14301524-Ditylum_brightwellii.AAC.1
MPRHSKKNGNDDNKPAAAPPPPPNAKPSAPNKPDHGENYVPGSEAAPDNLAPQPLDHFKRGYKERAELREREMSHLNMDFEHYRTAGTGSPENK